MRSLVIGGNWKLKVNSLEKTRKVLENISASVLDLDIDDSKEIFLALPYATLFLARDILSHSPVHVAAQSVHYDTSGPYTGEISVSTLLDLDVTYVLVGHSERRIIFGEIDEHINKKVHLVLEHGLKPVFCIGETAKQRNKGDYKEILSDQLTAGLKEVTPDQMSSVILAYEPVWAINNPLLNPEGEIKAATTEEANDTHQFIRTWLREEYGEKIASSTPIQYGGSMNPNNADSLLSMSDIDGGLIGSASVSAETFIPIIKSGLKI